jgi:hypothetical protein
MLSLELASEALPEALADLEAAVEALADPEALEEVLTAELLAAEDVPPEEQPVTNPAPAMATPASPTSFMASRLEYVLPLSALLITFPLSWSRLISTYQNIH